MKKEAGIKKGVGVKEGAGMKKRGRWMRGIAVMLSAAVCAGASPMELRAAEAGTAAGIGEEDSLQADGRNLRNRHGQGDVVNLRGTNAGGYLLQEFWMTPTADSANVHDESDIYEILEERFGEEERERLVALYQDAYWTESDFDNCAMIGVNCIRLPFWYRNLVDEDGCFYGYNADAEDPYAEAFERIDWFVREAGQRGIYVILDMHGAPGSQNGSDHSGVDGGDDKEKASEFFFGENAEANQQLYYDIWKVIAERYEGNPAVAGYDLLNEPFCTYRYSSRLTSNAQSMRRMLWEIYDKAYQTVRAVDGDHVIIMEAVWDPDDLPDPSVYGWQNVMYEYHNYLYDDYNNANGQQIANMEKKLNLIVAADYNVPSYMGEFSYFNNPDAWNEGLELLTESGINWTTWTYKTVSEYGNWGLCNHPAGMSDINLETAQPEEIAEHWGRVGAASPNTGLIQVVSAWLKADTVENQLYPGSPLRSGDEEGKNGSETGEACVDGAVNGILRGTVPH